jgi:hypothetical protein
VLTEYLDWRWCLYVNLLFAGLAAAGAAVLLPRIGPRPIILVGLLVAVGGMAWLTRIGVHSSYVSAVLGPLLVTGAGLGLSVAPSFNTGTFGVAPNDADVASGDAQRRPAARRLRRNRAAQHVGGALLRSGPLAPQAPAPARVPEPATSGRR